MPSGSRGPDCTFQRLAACHAANLAKARVAHTESVQESHAQDPRCHPKETRQYALYSTCMARRRSVCHASPAASCAKVRSSSKTMCMKLCTCKCHAQRPLRAVQVPKKAHKHTILMRRLVARAADVMMTSAPTCKIFCTVMPEDSGSLGAGLAQHVDSFKRLQGSLQHLQLLNSLVCSLRARTLQLSYSLSPPKEQGGTMQGAVLSTFLPGSDHASLTALGRQPQRACICTHLWGQRHVEFPREHRHRCGDIDLG